MDISLLESIANDFNECQSRHNLQFPKHFQWNDLFHTEKIIINANDSSKLSDLFLDNYCSQNSHGEFHHFTDLNALRSIVLNKCIWLTSVEKRYGEGEFNPFYQAHNMDGFERMTNENKSLADTIVRNTFYISLTKPMVDNEENFWDTFSSKNGVKIVFDFKAVNTHLRKIYYPNAGTRREISLLTEFIEIARKHKRYLIFDGLATIGFFYLPGLLSSEQEFRFLIKKEVINIFKFNMGLYPGTQYEYAELPLFENPLAQINVKKVVLRNVENREETLRILGSSPLFTNVKVEMLNI